MTGAEQKTNYQPGETFSTAIGDVVIRKFLGRGKSAYSYLVSQDDTDMVLKIMHNEPVPYYSFERNKVFLESNAYELLKSLGIIIPQMYCTNIEELYLVKEYIPGITGAEWIAGNDKNEEVIKQLFEISQVVESQNYNIDYFPANFVITGDKLYYIDYEINIFKAQWSLRNWGIYYWANEEGFREFRRSGDAASINIDLKKGLPIKEPFETQIVEWVSKYSV